MPTEQDPDHWRDVLPLRIQVQVFTEAVLSQWACGDLDNVFDAYSPHSPYHNLVADGFQWNEVNRRAALQMLRDPAVQEAVDREADDIIQRLMGTYAFIVRNIPTN